MKCPRCQAENREGAEFCGKCGKPTQAEKTCPQCGHSNSLKNNFCDKCGQPLTPAKILKIPAKPPCSQPTSFAGGRYKVKKFLGEGGKKKVYLAHDTTLDRDVAFALIKTEKLDDVARTRIKREARAMGKLGDHEGQPYIVLPLHDMPPSRI